MAKLKYAPGIVPIVNKHLGFTFLPNHYGHSVTSNQHNSRTRYHTQTQKMQNLLKCIRQWRNMSLATILAWETFATTYPQASRRNPAIFLTGYQLFLKRNHYVFLNEGIESDFMELPVLEALLTPDISFSINQVKNCMDVTEPYIQHYGNIPAAGQFVLLKAYPMAINSGQFFEPIIQTLEVLESYIDGLFLSINYVSASPSIMFSVYLSKVIHQSVKYAGTKVKYMSCFKPSTFLELTDTPATYVGQAANQVVVKADETGLEFVAGGGGGLTCADLPDCPTIISIQESIQAIAGLIIPTYNTSIPVVHFGLLYKRPTILDARFYPAGWSIFSHLELEAWLTSLGGNIQAGKDLIEPNLEYWITVNALVTNLKGFNGRGSGYRSTTGSFVNFKSYGYTWCSDLYSLNNAYCMEISASYPQIRRDTMVSGAFFGFGVRFWKDAAGIPDGVVNTLNGFNGRVYRTITIAGKEIMADNLAETLFSDGTPIPEITDNAQWQALTTPGLCALNNDWTNV